MIGLVYKDCMTLKKQLTTLLMFLLAYGALTVAGVFDVSILGALVTVMGMTIPMSSVALDDAARWDRYAVATPAGRRGVVAGKYVFTALVIVVSSIFAVLLMVGLSLAGLSKQTLTENLVVALSCAAVTLLLNAVILPFLLKYGAEKARVISMTVFVVIFGGALLLENLWDNGMVLPEIPAGLVQALPVLFCSLAVGAFVVSYVISLGIYNRKEF
ncbi:MAG TPA: ABC-2 transporter permease [Candidatus Avoscillospira avistercoris]|uniref:ABC-2 transporter permease n=1 Tax=Candidatus Avoscillospira avistercoris TaxID=2840707 RepID=A0A9D1F9B2_9FIRM|nr:ABC-2 transporter permease [Candidatus Avoscillospira avistercoris]